MSSKDVFRAKNNMSVLYHDFKAQYEKIANLIEKARPENVISQLNSIVATGKTTGQNYVVFHPQVIANFKTILE